jgi:UDP-2-acetamido-3-amino-2,3-dideoxy-glucuronate N-acetyltransferase
MNYASIRLGIIGCGRWGINHVKTAHALLGENLSGVADADPAAARKICEISPSIRFTPLADDLIDDPAVNCIVVATPAETHYAIATRCLEHGKHVLVEKPITMHSTEAKALIRLARRNDCRLMVGHVLLYHPAVIEMKKAICNGKIGKLEYLYSNRLNLGAIRSEENILWSFAPHDISVIQLLVGAKPLAVETHGARFLQNRIEDTTLTYMKYPNNVHAHIFVSWLHPFKEQRLVVIGDEGMLVFEDSQPADKLKYFHNGFHKTSGGFVKFTGNFESIPFDQVQPLEQEHRHFYHCIETQTTPLTDGAHALEVLEILEQAQRRLQDD